MVDTVAKETAVGPKKERGISRSHLVHMIKFTQKKTWNIQ